MHERVRRQQSTQQPNVFRKPTTQEHNARILESPSQSPSHSLTDGKSGRNLSEILQARQDDGRARGGSQEQTARQETTLQRATNVHLQAKLTLGEPDDAYEREADRVAAQVMRRLDVSSSAREPDLQQQTLEEDTLQAKPLVESIQRIHDARAEVQGEAAVMRRALGATSEVSEDVEQRIQRSRGQGQPMADEVRMPMERAFGADFSAVRVHADAESDRLNRAVQAKAFTTGRDIYFRSGRYEPGSRSGQELLAHELTHVVQQGGQTGVQRRVESGNSERVLPKKDSSRHQNEASVLQRRTASETESTAIEAQPEVAKETTEDSGSWWPEWIPEWLKGVLQGDYNEDPSISQIITRTLLTMVPVVDQVGDIQDLSAALYKLIDEGRYDEWGVWGDLVLTLVGMVPIVGSLVKGSTKILIKEIKQSEFIKQAIEAVQKKVLEPLSEKFIHATSELGKAVKEVTAAAVSKARGYREKFGELLEPIRRSLSVAGEKVSKYAGKIWESFKRFVKEEDGSVAIRPSKGGGYSRGTHNLPDSFHKREDFTLEEVEYGKHIDELREKGAIEFPDGTKVWRGEKSGGLIWHQTILKDKTPARKGYEKAKHSRKDFKDQESGVSPYPEELEYERSHTLGAINGFESPYGIYLAPKYVNNKLQRHGIEKYMKNLASNKPPGVEYQLTTSTSPIKYTSRLGKIYYEVHAIISKDGKTYSHPFFEYTIKIEGDGKDPIISAGPIKFSEDSSDTTIKEARESVEVPNTLKESVEGRIRALIKRDTK